MPCAFGRWEPKTISHGAQSDHDILKSWQKYAQLMLMLNCQTIMRRKQTRYSWKKWDRRYLNPLSKHTQTPCKQTAELRVNARREWQSRFSGAFASQLHKISNFKGAQTGISDQLGSRHNIGTNVLMVHLWKLNNDWECHVMSLGWYSPTECFWAYVVMCQDTKIITCYQ